VGDGGRCAVTEMLCLASKGNERVLRGTEGFRFVGDGGRCV